MQDLFIFKVAPFIAAAIAIELAFLFLVVLKRKGWRKISRWLLQSEAMSESMPSCPSCQSLSVVKNGSTRHGKQNYKCRDCGRQFVENPKWQRVSERIQDTYDLLEKLLLEKIPLAGIARVLKISERWLQSYVNHKYEDVPQQVEVEPKPKHRLTIQMDELWSFVDDKGKKQWAWLAIDAETREIVGCYIGDRSGESAQKLWESLPNVYRQCAVIYTDFYMPYSVVLPSKRHRAVGKETGKTNYIERFNCTLRQRVSRLVRKTLSFSKKLENHIGAIWNFIHYYNASLPARSSFPF